LRWSAESAIELEEARSADFNEARVIYSGSDRARVMSGKPDGDWYYRARAQASNSFSNTVNVTVSHHPIGRAFAYFAVGSVVFVATLLTILGGTRKTGSKQTMQ
jgi:hypothetical protein